MSPEMWTMIRMGAPWALGAVAVLTVLLIVNQPVFRMIDEMIYGSAENAQEAVRANEEWAQWQENNMFRQAESWLTTGHSYRAERHMTTGQVAKCGLIVVELLALLWFVSLFIRR